MKNTIHKIISVICAAAVLAVNTSAELPIIMPAYAESAFYSQSGSQSGRTVQINDIEGFLKLAEDCRMDSASKNLKVVLTADISLSGIEFFGIPIFCGTFDGGGHTVSGFSIHDSASEMGLFRHVERGAVIKDLTVAGIVSPSGSRDMVGGIVGINRGTITSCKFRGSVSGNNAIGGIVGKNDETGVISSCESSAAIAGEGSVGGIVGTNLGIIIDCSNSGGINAVYTDSEINTDELDLENPDSLANMSANNVIGKSDIGGIAGFSSGIIQRCSNSGTVGYQHIGYNIGGIVGRQSGILVSCKNTGSVFGRKDVGGIAGQMEPYRSIEFSEDAAQRLGAEMDILSDSVDKLISDARNSGSRINSEIQTLTSQMNAAQKNADEITDRAESVFNGYSEGINELLARADTALDGALPALNSLDAALELLGSFSDKCAEALRELEQAGAHGSDAAEAAHEALKDIDKALPSLEAGLRDISNALRTIQKSLGDPEQVKSSLKEITKSLDSITDNMKDVSDAAKRLNTAFENLSNWLNGSDWQALKNSVTALSDSLADVLSALGDMSGAIGDIAAAVDSGEMNKALSELNTASASLGKAAAKLASAMRGGKIPDNDELKAAADELQKAADALQQASDHLNAAVDPDEMKKALDELQKASKELDRALTRASDAANDMSDALDKIASSDVPENTMKTVSAQMKRLLDSLSEISNDLSNINRQVSDLLDEIDASGLSSAMGDLASAADNIAGAVGSIGDAGGSVEGAVKSLGEALDSLSSASSAASDAAEIMSQISGKLSEAVKQIEDVTKTLSGKSEIRFPALDNSFTSAADNLSANMKAMISTLSRIGNTANSEGSALLDDVQDINDCLSRIFEIFKDTYKDLLSDDEKAQGFSEDISENDSANESRHGKALGCSNSGIVAGDVNVGGITGSMAIEFDLDPEDDITLNGDRSINFSYNVMDIIENCENSGKVTAKKNYCGGIVGKMDMGLVKNSRSSGTVLATSGSYVGGIAGYSSAKLRGCYSKVTLSGTAYIGGIAGECGIMTDCLSISDITEFSEKIGALAGYVDFSKKNVEIARNYFVDRRQNLPHGIAGIDRISYAGIAEPMSYSQFAARTGDFADIEIEFTADGKTLAKLKIPYGGSVNESDIPEIPKKSGFYSRWKNTENFDFENITFPGVLEAEYIQMLTSVGSDKKSEQGLPLVLADGSFDDTFSVKIETESSSIFAPEGSELRIVTIGSDTDLDSKPTALRFLKTGDNPKLMQYINGAWKAISFTENGSYLIVNDPSLENGSAAFCVSGSAVNSALIITLAVIAAVIIAVIVILILIKKNRSNKKQKQHN